MIGRPRKSTRTVYVGPWCDMGQGRCSKCRTERRLYSPLTKLDLLVCADCSQPSAFSGLPNTDHDDRLPTDDAQQDFQAGFRFR